MILIPQLSLLFGLTVMIALYCMDRLTSPINLMLLVLLLFVSSLWLTEDGVYWQIWQVDFMSKISQTFCAVLTGIILVWTKDAFGDKMFSAALLIFIALIGCVTIISCKHLMLLFIGLELLALPTYTLCAIEDQGLEASLKYFLMGAVASIFILYGLSFIYGAVGSLFYNQISAWQLTTADSMMFYLKIGVVFFLAGMFFKLGVAPFHLWVPDVYQSAPIGVVTWLSVVPKIAITVMLIRFGLDSQLYNLDVWNQIISLMAIFTLIYGVLMAVAQNNIRRLIGYASVAHMGFVLLPLQLSTPIAYAASLTYMFGYVVITLVAMMVIYRFEQRGYLTIRQLSGVASVLPHESFVFLLAMAAMAGIPPLVGFIIKLNVFYVLLSNEYVLAPIVAAIAVAISAYYYMSMIKSMYFDTSSVKKIHLNYIILPFGALLILMGIIPQGYLVIFNQAILGV